MSPPLVAWIASLPSPEQIHKIFIEQRNQIAIANKGLLYKIVNRFSRKNQIPLEDLESVGMIGLLKAIELFEPERGYQFSSYAGAKIRGELLHYQRDKCSPGGLKIPRRWTDHKGKLERGEPCRAVPDNERADALEALKYQQIASLNRQPSEDGSGAIPDRRMSGDPKLTSLDLCHSLGFQTRQGYFNATRACKIINPSKRPYDFLRLTGTRRKKLAQNTGKSRILRKRGRDGSTWLHYELAADFMIWLSPESRDKLLSVLSAELVDLYD
jgi:RNA polymerase sigma factor (sigma-70 family)